MKTLKIVFAVDWFGFAENLTVPLLSALAKQDGHSIRLVIFSRNPQAALNEITDFHPDIVIYSLCSNEAQRYRKFNLLLKSRIEVFSLFGGPHPTFYPEFIREEGIDAICRGEGDTVFPEFLRRFGDSGMRSTPNFSFKDGSKVIENPLCELVDDLDEIPFPDRALMYEKSYFFRKNPIKTFMAGRGCPFRCSYCFNHAFNKIYQGKGRVMRIKSVGRIIAEIKDVAQRYPLSFVKFHDDIFGFEPGWLQEFSQRFPAEIGLPFLCYTRPNVVSDSYAAALGRAGCRTVTMAIECGNDTIRNQVLRRNLSTEEIIDACGILKKHGIRIHTLNMLGLPGETETELRQTLELNQKLKPIFADASIFQPYPGTDINEYCKNNGYLSDNSASCKGLYTDSPLNFPPVFKDRIYITHRLFSLMVDHPALNSRFEFIFRLRHAPFFKRFLDLIYRFYYGHNLSRRAYLPKLPLGVRIRGAFILFGSPDKV